MTLKCSSPALSYRIAFAERGPFAMRERDPPGEGRELEGRKCRLRIAPPACEGRAVE
jgi:hypothetical protein